MKSNSHISYLLTDHISRSSYQEGEDVTLDDIERRLMIIAREHNYVIPHHYLRLVSESSFRGITKVSQVFTQGLIQLANDFLERRNNRIYVRIEKFNAWQEQIAYIPPMLLISAYIFNNVISSITDITSDSFYNQYIAPNLGNTSLIPPYISQLEELKKENNGFNDLHIHLNGTMETDSVWLDILHYPERVIHNMEESAKGNKLAKEQYEQFDNWTRPDKLKRLIMQAIKLRDFLFSEICKVVPVIESFTRQAESSLYISVLHYLSMYPDNKEVASSFHHYLLILGLVNQMLVQQPQCFGFEQFQQYTSNGLREYSEQEYEQRFLQLAGNQLDNIRIIEGRFSPKDIQDKNDQLIDKIRRGWLLLNNRQDCNKSDIKLIAHFIKRADKQKKDIRFKELRLKNKKICEALISLRNSGSKNGKAIVGIDAAASEFDTPPEVFAPVFKKLRKKGFQHFTYHAGEDFYHLLGGLRAIYEAIIFLDLQRGDRIGHATAAGVAPETWAHNVGCEVVVPIGAYMDDLLFVYNLISNNECKALDSLMPRLYMRITELSREIYPNDDFQVYDLIYAWKRRQEDILELVDSGELNNIKALKRYHQKEYVEKYKKEIKVKIFEILDEKALREVQLAVLKIMHHKEIAIETLPTSNIFIGYHNSFNSYHLVNWIRWEKEGKPIPPIVLGTDDAGIFATNIYNEYCHIYTLLVYEYDFCINEAFEIIRKINRDANYYIFNNDSLNAANK
ncbi:amidohydrolase family protein [Prevotella melaninogenica]|uniref:hypothetical protein n=1 Tax=Prevotella melaninogenica TaxID=28132 RepID=UPI0001AEB3D2|nr:hypothetical protein [Prevotella melaninogenica]ASE18088.1 hypothetical protein CEP85_08025 [Prevotella melaninogenica]